MTLLLTFLVATAGAVETPAFFEDAWIKRRAGQTHLFYPAELPAWLLKPVPNPAVLAGWNDQWAMLTREFAIPLRVGGYFARTGAMRAAELEIPAIARALGRINAAIRDVTDTRVAVDLLRFVLAQTVETVSRDLGFLTDEQETRVKAFFTEVSRRVATEPELARADRAWGRDARGKAFFGTCYGAFAAGMLGHFFSATVLVHPWDAGVGLAAAMALVVFAREKFPPSARRAVGPPVIPHRELRCAERLTALALIED